MQKELHRLSKQLRKVTLLFISSNIIIYFGLSPLPISFKTQREWLQDGGRALNAWPGRRCSKRSQDSKQEGIHCAFFPLSVHFLYMHCVLSLRPMLFNYVKQFFFI